MQKRRTVSNHDLARIGEDAVAVNALNERVPIAVCFSVAGVKVERPCTSKLTPSLRHIVVAQHDTSPGHGCATRMSIGTSTLAQMVVVPKGYLFLGTNESIVACCSRGA
jgi:hypothetical protein